MRVRRGYHAFVEVGVLQQRVQEQQGAELQLVGCVGVAVEQDHTLRKTVLEVGKALELDSTQLLLTYTTSQQANLNCLSDETDYVIFFLEGEWAESENGRQQAERFAH